MPLRDVFRRDGLKQTGGAVTQRKAGRDLVVLTLNVVVVFQFNFGASVQVQLADPLLGEIDLRL
jgi:hypothetical protein